MAFFTAKERGKQNGLYIYDAIGRLRDAQLAATDRLKDEDFSRLNDQASYIRWGQLGRAFQQERRTVVLILNG